MQGFHIPHSRFSNEQAPGQKSTHRTV